MRQFEVMKRFVDCDVLYEPGCILTHLANHRYITSESVWIVDDPKLFVNQEWHIDRRRIKRYVKPLNAPSANIHHNQHAEQRLAQYEIEKRMDALVEAAPCGTFCTDIEGWNELFVEFCAARPTPHLD